MKKDIQEKFHAQVKELFLSCEVLEYFGIENNTVLVNGHMVYLWTPFEKSDEGKIWLIETGLNEKVYFDLKSLMLHYLNNITHFLTKK